MRKLLGSISKIPFTPLRAFIYGFLALLGVAVVTALITAVVLAVVWVSEIALIVMIVFLGSLFIGWMIDYGVNG